MIDDLKPYAEYKDSGLTWLGEVPSHWTVLPAFGAFKPNMARNIGMKEKTVLSLSYGRIVIKPTEKLHGLVPESFETYQIVDPGDIVLRTTDLQNDHTSLRVGMVRDRGIITSAYLALRVLSGVSPEYGFQFLNVWDSSKAIYGYGSGLRQNLDFSHFKRMPIPIPPPAEQAAIVRFLAWASSRLERAIRAKRKVIALLNEQKQAIIHRAVTLGLDPTVPLKASGIPWLGDIPEHWEVKRLGALLRERGEGNDHGEVSHVLSLLRGRGVIPYDEKGNIGNKKSEDITRYKIVRPDDIVMNCMNVIIGSVGISRYTGCLSPVYYVLVRRNESDSPSYLNAIFQCSTFHRSLVRIGNGILAHRMRIPMELLKCELLPYPPCAEQAQIIEGLHSATEAFDNAIDRTEREMDLLREYRTRLVSDVVTGKLDVREAAAGLPDEEPLPDGAASDDESDATTDELLVDEETLV